MTVTRTVFLLGFVALVLLTSCAQVPVYAPNLRDSPNACWLPGHELGCKLKQT